MAKFYLDADVKTELGLMLASLGHDVVHTSEVGRRRAHDEEQLAYSAGHGRVLVTHNRGDFLLLQRAWRYWSDIWMVEPRPVHAGILIPLQPPRQTSEEAAAAIDRMIRSGRPLTNRFYEWVTELDWVQYG